MAEKKNIQPAVRNLAAGDVLFRAPLDVVDVERQAAAIDRNRSPNCSFDDLLKPAKQIRKRRYLQNLQDLSL